MNVGPSSSIAIRIRVSRFKWASFSPSRFLKKPLTRATSNRLTQSAKPYLLRIVRISPQRFTLRYTLGMVVIFIAARDSHPKRGCEEGYLNSPLDGVEFQSRG